MQELREIRNNSATGLSCESALPTGAGLVLVAAFLGWMFDGLEQAIFPLIARPALRQMMHTSNDGLVGMWYGYITAAWLLGAAGGGLIFGWLGDQIGRVRSMALSVLVYSAFTGLGFFAQHPWHLLALRFVAALGLGGEWSLGVALVMECWPDQRRPLMAGIIGLSANFGYVIISALAMVFKVTETSWRWVMLAGVSPALLTFLIRLFVPESEKWKHSVATGGPTRPVREALSMPIFPRTLLGIMLASIALIGTWAAVQQIPAWIDKLTDGREPFAKAQALLLTAVGAMIGCFGAALLAGRWGRRITYFTLSALSLIASGILFRCFHVYNPAMMVMIFLVGLLTAAFYGWMPLYLPELFPTRVRATGQGIAYNSGRIFAAGGAIWGGTLVKLFDGSYARACSILTLVYAVGMVVIWLAPETKGKALPE
jgi:MFS family permease